MPNQDVVPRNDPFLSTLWSEIDNSDVFIKKLFKLAPTKGKNPGNLNADVLDKKLDKKGVCELLMEALVLVKESKSVMRDAAIELDDYKDQVIKSKSELAEIQKRLIARQDKRFEKLEGAVTNKIQNTLQSEMQTYSAAVSKSPDQSGTTPLSANVIRSVVKTTLTEDERKRNIIIFGLEECDNKMLKTSVTEVLQEIGHKPIMTVVTRLGQIGTKPRPVKVVCESPDTVHSILRSSPQLKKSDKFKHVYISFDRTQEQRLEHRKLVSELKKRIAEGPRDTRFYIKNGKVVSDPEAQPPVQAKLEDKSDYHFHCDFEGPVTMPDLQQILSCSEDDDEKDTGAETNLRSDEFLD